MFEYKREMPTITADIICWNVSTNEKFHKSLNFLLIKRKKDPFKNCWALPGGHFEVKSDATIEDAAIRELQEETGIVANNNLKFFKYYDEMGRDPRGRYIDFVFETLVSSDIEVVPDDDAISYCWLSELEIETTDLAFDHKKVISDFVKYYFHEK